MKKWIESHLCCTVNPQLRCRVCKIPICSDHIEHLNDLRIQGNEYGSDGSWCTRILTSEDCVVEGQTDLRGRHFWLMCTDIFFKKGI